MRKPLFAVWILLLGSPDLVFSATGGDAIALDAHNVAFVQLMFGQPDGEHPPLPQEPIDVNVVAVPRGFEPSFVAGDQCGLIVFAVGLVGWIALGVAVLVVERFRRTAA